MAITTFKDGTPTTSGTHGGSNGASILYDKDKYFDVLITIGVDCHNITQGTNGSITDITKDTVTVSDVNWDLNDKYEIYITNSKDSFISSYKTTKLLGRKWTKYYTDEDEQDEPDDVFTTGQPERSHT